MVKYVGSVEKTLNELPPCQSALPIQICATQQEYCYESTSSCHDLPLYCSRNPSGILSSYHQIPPSRFCYRQFPTACCRFDDWNQYRKPTVGSLVLTLWMIVVFFLQSQSHVRVHLLPWKTSHVLSGVQRCIGKLSVAECSWPVVVLRFTRQARLRFWNMKVVKDDCLRYRRRVHDRKERLQGVDA